MEGDRCWCQEALAPWIPGHTLQGELGARVSGKAQAKTSTGGHF